VRRYPEMALRALSGMSIGVHVIAAHYLLNQGTEEQKRRYLPRMARIKRRRPTAALSAVRAHRGTDGSNPFPSSRQSVSLRISPSFLEKPGFSASVATRPGGTVGRDAQAPATSR